jgi:hypothetical protein
MHSKILAPVVALVLWSFVMWAWLIVTRVGTIKRLRLRLDPTQPGDGFKNQLPPDVRWKADNYNHLMEQPTLFYAIALVLALLGEGSGANLVLAWLYVASRIAHSLVHVTVNRIMLRFQIFVAGSLALLALTARAAYALF